MAEPLCGEALASCAGLSLNGLIGTSSILNHHQDAPSRTDRTRKLSHPTMADGGYGCYFRKGSVREDPCGWIPQEALGRC